MSKNNTIEFLNSLQRFGWKLGLSNIRKLLKTLGNPERRLKSVHIAGTNGKGSTAAILESIFRNAGYKTGLYTSPNLLHVNERIQINGSPISNEQLSRYVAQIKPSVQSIGNTYFETLTAVAFQYFADNDVDIAFIEVGLGGRFDATNVISPVLSVITEIDLEHTEHLGATVSGIAREKAGIIKRRVPCLVQSTKPEVKGLFVEVCHEKNAELILLDEECSLRPIRFEETYSEFHLSFREQQFENLKLRLPGQHQLRNAALAVAAALNLQKDFAVTIDHIYRGLETTVWPARLEKMQDSPKVVIDVAHNPAAFRKLVNALREIYHFERLFFVIGLLNDKNYQEISAIISELADYIFIAAPQSERGLKTKNFAAELKKHNRKFEIVSGVKNGFGQAMGNARGKDLICVTGSHVTVGEFLHFYKKT